MSSSGPAADLLPDWHEYASHALQQCDLPLMDTGPFADLDRHHRSTDPDRPKTYRPPNRHLRNAIEPAINAFEAVQSDGDAAYQAWRNRVGETYRVAASLALMADQAPLAETYATTADSYGQRTDNDTLYNLVKLVKNPSDEQAASLLCQLGPEPHDRSDIIMDAYLATGSRTCYDALLTAARGDPLLVPYIARQLPAGHPDLRGLFDAAHEPSGAKAAVAEIIRNDLDPTLPDTDIDSYLEAYMTDLSDNVGPNFRDLEFAKDGPDRWEHYGRLIVRLAPVLKNHPKWSESLTTHSAPDSDRRSEVDNILLARTRMGDIDAGISLLNSCREHPDIRSRAFRALMRQIGPQAAVEYVPLLPPEDRVRAVGKCILAAVLADSPADSVPATALAPNLPPRGIRDSVGPIAKLYKQALDRLPQWEGRALPPALHQILCLPSMDKLKKASHEEKYRLVVARIRSQNDRAREAYALKYLIQPPTA
jgi:hypothetical protein